MKNSKVIFTHVLTLIIVFTLNSAQTEANASPIGASAPNQQVQLNRSLPEKGKTPLQHALKAAIDKRNQSGSPVPSSVIYDYHVVAKPNQPNTAGISEGNIIITATTILQFNHPNQAGLGKWPDPVIADALPPTATGFSAPGNYTNSVQNFLTQKLPGIWDKYEFGYEPRKYTFRETYKITYSDKPTQTRLLNPITNSNLSTVEEIVFGFTEAGPGIDYIFEEEWEECFLGICVTVAEVKAGLELDWDIGLRLPVEVSLVTPASMIIGPSYMLTSTINSLDWSAAQYQQAGLEPVEGNEFVLRYVIFLGVRAEIIGIDVVDWAIDAEYDASASFTTPFGPGTSFPLPSLELSPDETGLEWDIIPSVLAMGLGLIIHPSLSHGEITAVWQAVPGSDATGSGVIAYIDPQTPTIFGPVTAGDFSPDTSQAHIRLAEFQYGLDEFLLELGGFLEFELFGFDVETSSFDIADFNLDDISDGAWLDVHDGTKETVEGMIEVRPNPGSSIFIYLPLIKK